MGYKYYWRSKTFSIYWLFLDSKIIEKYWYFSYFSSSISNFNFHIYSFLILKEWTKTFESNSISWFKCFSYFLYATFFFNFNLEKEHCSIGLFYRMLNTISVEAVSFEYAIIKENKDSHIITSKLILINTLSSYQVY